MSRWKWSVIALLIVIVSLSIPALSQSPKRVLATLVSCIDGDTARLEVSGRSEKVRFLAIDTPETDPATRDGIEPFGKEASQATCDALKSASKIELEQDPQADERDDYGRLLAWVFTDGHLLQAELVKAGLAQVAYLYGDYSYTEDLQALQAQAKARYLGIWSR